MPFLLGLALAAFSFHMQRGLPKTKLFNDHVKGHVDDNPLHEALTRNLRQTILAVLFASGYGVFFYVPLVYLPSYANTVSGVDLGSALWTNSLAIALILPLIPVTGLASDRWARRRTLLLAAFGAMAVIAWPVFIALAHGGAWTLAVGQILFAILIAFPLGIAPATFAEMFPTEDRITGYSVAFNLGIGVVGGTAPMIATGLIKLTGNPIAPGLYLAALSLVSVVALIFMKDHSREPLM